ncbi:Uncharacterized protein SCF082_LOCUS20874 [Durusdinium trenchii]|uniref:Uncharacterized protein n=2 Tax=Durusdinium trenchii TaxID=1381693 RepID=A0ABP0L8D1_9DINO
MEGLQSDSGTAFAVTVLSVLATRVWFWDFHQEIPFACGVLRSSLVRPDDFGNLAEVNVRVVEGRATYFKAITTFWGLTSDLLLCLFPFTRTMATSLMAPDFWCCVVATVVLRLCALPSVDLQQKDVETVILFLNALCVGIGYGIPPELIPALCAGRLLLALMFLNPVHALWTNLALSPFYISIAVSLNPGGSVTATIFNELFLIAQLTLVCVYVDVNVKKAEASTISMETKTKEAHTSVAAACRLLSVTCDSFVQLTADLRIKDPQRSFLELLAGGYNLEGASMIDLISPADRNRFLDVISESDENSRDGNSVDLPARSLSLQLLDTLGTTLEARLYFVQIPSTDSSETRAEHLIGITEIVSNQVVASRAGSRADTEDMRFLLGSRVPQEEQKSGTRSAPRSRTSEVGWKSLKGLQNVKFMIDATSVHDGFRIYSVEFNFDKEEKSSILPNLLEWVQPDTRQTLFCWIQDHVNAFASGTSCDTFVERVQLLDPLQSQSLLAGKVVALDMKQEAEHSNQGLVVTETSSNECHGSDCTEQETEEACPILFQIQMSDFFTPA